MPLTATQKAEILQVIDTLYNYSSGRRLLSQMFRTLPDRHAWKAYYDVIPQPRSLETVKVSPSLTVNWSSNLTRLDRLQ